MHLSVQGPKSLRFSLSGDVPYLALLPGTSHADSLDSSLWVLPLSWKDVSSVLSQDPFLEDWQGLSPFPTPDMKTGPSEKDSHISLML